MDIELESLTTVGLLALTRRLMSSTLLLVKEDMLVVVPAVMDLFPRILLKILPLAVLLMKCESHQWHEMVTEVWASDLLIVKVSHRYVSIF